MRRGIRQTRGWAGATNPANGSLAAWDSTKHAYVPIAAGLTSSFIVVDDNGDPWTLVFVKGVLISRTAYSAGNGTPIGLLLALTRV